MINRICGKLNKARRIVSDSRGMTMAELLIVIAIIIVLAGVAFISLVNYQRNLAQFERDKIAKEIFYAAQNHLTIARGEGYLDLDQDDPDVTGYEETEGDEGTGVYYFIYPLNSYSLTKDSILDLMLPFGSIEENTRIGGSYIIRYHKNSGRVMDVFYCSRKGSPQKFNHSFSLADYTTGEIVENYAGDSKKKARRKYESQDGRTSVLGWYGGDNGDGWKNPEILIAPEIKVVNKEQLYVEVTDKNSGRYSLKLIITGETSGAMKSYKLLSDSDVAAEAVDVGVDDRIEKSGEKYKIVLDDITTKGMHFANIDADTDKKFIPGENIKIQAVAYSLSSFTSIEYSAEKTTNSIFADNGKSGVSMIDTGYINNIRHLENLDYTVSNLNNKNDADHMSLSLSIDKGVQTDNLYWSDDETATRDFVTGIKTLKGSSTDPAIYKYDATGNASTDAGYYLPVNMSGGLTNTALSYDGSQYSITGIKAKSDSNGNSGLFGSLTDSVVKNVKLIDFEITATGGNAGMLAGQITGSSNSKMTVTNVIAVNTRESTYRAKEKNLSVDGGNAGGLIGNMNGGTVRFSAASVRVKGTTAAGGLIGTSSGEVTGCYSGGHTENGLYKEWVEDNDYDITGATVGGLIGSAGNTAVSYSYSTCSVSGSGYTGGLVGSASGTISKCYATGAVETEEINNKDDRETNKNSGSFAGTFTGTASDCLYFSSINEVIYSETQGSNKKTEIDHLLGAVGDKEKTDGITAIDASTAKYNEFVGGTWGNAWAYDPDLVKYYKNKYNLETVRQLYGETEPDGYSSDFFIRAHYGDWPAPEVFALNTKSN